MITSTNTKTTDLNLPTLLPKYIRHVRVQKCMNYEEYINDQVPPTLVLLSWIRLSALHSKSFVCTRDLQSWYFSNHVKNKRSCLLRKIQDVTPMRPNWKEWSSLDGILSKPRNAIPSISNRQALRFIANSRVFRFCLVTYPLLNCLELVGFESPFVAYLSSAEFSVIIYYYYYYYYYYLFIYFFVFQYFI